MRNHVSLSRAKARSFRPRPSRQTVATPVASTYSHRGSKPEDLRDKPEFFLLGIQILDKQGKSRSEKSQAPLYGISWDGNTLTFDAVSHAPTLLVQQVAALEKAVRTPHFPFENLVIAINRQSLEEITDRALHMRETIFEHVRVIEQDNGEVNLLIHNPYTHSHLKKLFQEPSQKNHVYEFATLLYQAAIAAEKSLPGKTLDQVFQERLGLPALPYEIQIHFDPEVTVVDLPGTYGAVFRAITEGLEELAYLETPRPGFRFRVQIEPPPLPGQPLAWYVARGAADAVENALHNHCYVPKGVIHFPVEARVVVPRHGDGWKGLLAKAYDRGHETTEVKVGCVHMQGKETTIAKESIAAELRHALHDMVQTQKNYRLRRSASYFVYHTWLEILDDLRLIRQKVEKSRDPATYPSTTFWGLFAWLPLGNAHVGAIELMRKIIFDLRQRNVREPETLKRVEKALWDFLKDDPLYPGKDVFRLFRQAALIWLAKTFSEEELQAYAEEVKRQPQRGQFLYRLLAGLFPERKNVMEWHEAFFREIQRYQKAGKKRDSNALWSSEFENTFGGQVPEGVTQSPAAFRAYMDHGFMDLVAKMVDFCFAWAGDDGFESSLSRTHHRKQERTETVRELFAKKEALLRQAIQDSPFDLPPSRTFFAQLIGIERYLPVIEAALRSD